jgi:hypothetical protein
MYGVDKSTHWFDHDLTSAYTTGKTDMPLPDYHNAYLVNKEKVLNWSDELLMNGYLFANCDFLFPSNTKY